VLPNDQREELELLVAATTQGARLTGWGFGAATRPPALVALFAGPSGTGKTMAAGLVARRAGLPLHRIDLSAVVSKYIGETEKQLDQVLREAEAIGAALLFDEADALFGKRAEVKDARDRYANQEVAFLLHRIECFDGLVILTTNLGGHIDQAFLRRIAYAVHFPMPDEAMRAELWRRAFPGAAPLAADLDLDLLARSFEITGGNIRNAALGAAHRAAAEDRAITMPDAVRAVAREVRKLGRLPSRAEFGPLYAALASGALPGGRAA
jgi:SpoVK/Ycf46/Vps4 family AAA+-type ATPase